MFTLITPPLPLRRLLTPCFPCRHDAIADAAITARLFVAAMLMSSRLLHYDAAMLPRLHITLYAAAATPLRFVAVFTRFRHAVPLYDTTSAAGDYAAIVADDAFAIAVTLITPITLVIISPLIDLLATKIYFARTRALSVNMPRASRAHYFCRARLMRCHVS